MRLTRCYTPWYVKLAIITLLLLADQCVASTNIPSKSVRIDGIRKRADPPPAPTPTPPPTPLRAAVERFETFWRRLYTVRYSFTSDKTGIRPEAFNFAAEWYPTNTAEINNALARAIENWPLEYDPNPGVSDLGRHLVHVKSLLTTWLTDTENWSPEGIVRALILQMNSPTPDLTFYIEDSGVRETLTFTMEEAYILTLLLFWPAYTAAQEPTHEGGVVVYERGESSQQPLNPDQNPCTVENPPGVPEACSEFCKGLLLLIFLSCLIKSPHPPPLEIRNITMF